jgi:RNA polymerase subunit RPABC4/transcription elongation factor Spt4
MMALIACPECEKKISDSAHVCPNCGYPLTPERVLEIKKTERESRKRLGLIILSTIAIFLVLCVIGSFISSDSSNNRTISKNIVYNSELDGSVEQVKSWLQENLKDPDSLQFIEWSPVQKIYDGRFMVRVKYRAKNSFGGYVIENKIFSLDSSGNLVNVSDSKF